MLGEGERDLVLCFRTIVMLEISESNGKDKLEVRFGEVGVNLRNGIENTEERQDVYGHERIRDDLRKLLKDCGKLFCDRSLHFECAKS